MEGDLMDWLCTPGT